MNDQLMERIQESSDNYSRRLWRRFMEKEAFNPQEEEIFAKVRPLFDGYTGEMHPDDLHKMLTDHGIRTLPMSFFAPGARADLFINCHNSFMNGFPHAHDYFEIVYLCKGEVTDWIDGTEIRLKKGDICIHNPNASNMITDMDDNEDFVLTVILPPRIFRHTLSAALHQNRQLDAFFNQYSLSADNTENYMYFPDNSVRIDMIMELLAEEFLRGEDSSDFIIESTLTVFFAELIRNYRPDPFLKELTEFITDNLETASLESAAAHFGYHRNYLSVLVRQRTGATFLQLLTEVRMQKAVSLLRYSDHSIEKISESLGYRSTASFFHHFENSFHMTPAAWRRSQKENG